MIDTLKPYPAYKDTFLPWVGFMPSHWQLRRTKVLFRERVQKGFPDEPLLAATQTKGVVRKEDYGSRTVTAQKDLHLLKLVEAGDFVISLRSFEGGIEVAHCRGIISPAYTILEPKMETLGGFYAHFFKSPDFIRSLTLFVTGIREGQNIDYKRMSRAYMPVPPVDEQKGIAGFLDYANRRIGRFIRAKQKVIALLNQQKQAIVHHALTRGVDYGVTMQASHVTWLPEAPTSWTWIPIKRLLSRMDYGTSEVGKGSGEIRLLTMANIQNGEIRLPDTGDLDAVPDALLLEHNDLLFTRTNGNPDLVGKVGIFRGHVTDKVSFASYLVRLRVAKEHSPEWLHLVLNSVSFWPFARSHALVNLQTNLNSTRYGQLAIPVPPKEAQVAIVDWVNKESKYLIMASHRAQREIGQIREYRMRLIADVVTGKLDVRAAVANLPNNVDTDPTDEQAGMLELDQEEAANAEMEAASQETDA